MGEFPWVLHPWDGCKFCPPTWHIQLVGLPIQPGFNIYDGGLWGVIFPTFFRVWFNLWFLECHPSPLLTTRDFGHLSKEQLCRQLLLQLQEWVCGASLIPQLNLSMSLLSTLAASSTLWQATLISHRASSYESFILGLDQCLSTGPHVSSAVARYTCQCNWLLREERMSWITSLLH